MERLLERFCRYVKIDTEAREGADTYPSSPGQLELARMLLAELRELGLADAAMDEHGIVIATVPASAGCPPETPTIAWNAHVDTSPETSGRGVKPIVHRDYQGGDITLPGDASKVIREAESPELKTMIGRTLITSDGTTLLGADDKAGVAIIMSAAEHLLKHADIVHGPIRVVFTCDEEIGRGVDFLDIKKVGAVAAYTLDGGDQGIIDAETFSADLATITVTGVNTHPSEAKAKRMVNAIRILAEFITRLPRKELSPETTDGRDGFLHPYGIGGGVASASVKVLLRDFETPRLADEAELLRSIAAALGKDYPRASIDVAIKKQYRNMRDGMEKEPRAIPFAEDAMRRCGLEPKRDIIRGGTDGSRMTELGLPCPNLSSGQHNLHSPLEWACLDQMAKARDVLVALAQVWAGQ
ncbi:MAG: peptidase T [Phycisphaerae bacterium]